MNAVNAHFEHAGTYTLSIRRDGGRPKYPQLIYLQSRCCPTACWVFTGAGIALLCVSIVLLAHTRRVNR